MLTFIAKNILCIRLADMEESGAELQDLTTKSVVKMPSTFLLVCSGFHEYLYLVVLKVKRGNV